MGNPFKSLEKSIKKSINRLGDEVKRGINKTGEDVRSGIRKRGEEVTGNLQSVSREVTDELESKADKFKHEIEDVAGKAIDELEDDVKETIEAIFSEMASAGFRKAVNVLKKAERIGETALGDASFGVDLSLISLNWNDIGGRVGEIRGKIEGLVDKPPKLTRSYILEVVKTVAPDQIGLSLDVKLAALVVTSDDLAVGFNFTVSLPAFLDASDELLDALGV